MAPPIRISPIFCFCFCALLVKLISFSEANDDVLLPLQNLPLRSDEPVDDVRDLLTKYGFPKGILPDNVKSNNLSDKGVLRVELQKRCTVSLGIRCNTKIRARLAYGSLTRVNGIRGLTEHGFWLTVVAIQMNENSGTVGFSIGGLFKDFAAKEFNVALHVWQKEMTWKSCEASRWQDVNKVGYLCLYKSLLMPATGGLFLLGIGLVYGFIKKKKKKNA